MPREPAFKQDLCADINGFSLHASVRCDAEDRKGLEQLCRTITRPALANERVQCNAAGQVVLKLKTPWRDGTTHQGTPPLEFMQRLAAPAIEERPSVARATPTTASDPFARRAGTFIHNFGQAARDGGPASAGPGRPCGATQRVRGELRAPPQAGATELGQAAQARFRDRSGRLPELRR